jgi:hypothetical protein
MATHTLTPIVPGAAAAVLLSVPVPEQSYWMVESNLRHRFPMAIVRIEG